MPDTRTVARPVDPAALRAFLDATQPDIFSALVNSGPPTREEAAESPAPRTHHDNALRAADLPVPAEAPKRLSAEGTFEPSSTPAAASRLRATPSADDRPTRWPVPREWEQSPALIEASRLLPASEPPATTAAPSWPAAREAAADWNSQADAPSSSNAGDRWGDASSWSIDQAAPRLIQAAERLEAAALQLARQAGRSAGSTASDRSIAFTNVPTPRPFRGRVDD